MHSNDLRSDNPQVALRASDPLSPSNAHVVAALSDFASSYSNGAFFADRVSPIIPVDKDSDSFFQFARKDATTDTVQIVGEQGAIPQSTIETSKATYVTLGYGQRAPVSRALQVTADPAVRPKERSTAAIMRNLMLAREIRVASKITTSGNWASGNNAAATAVWTDQTAGVPLTDIHTALEAIPASGDDSMLIAICALEVFNALTSHPQIRDMHGTLPGPIDEPTLAKYLKFDELLVSNTQKNTANTGQDPVYGRVWLDTVFAIVKVPRQLMGVDQEMFSATFRRNMEGASGGMLVREWEEPSLGTEGTDMVAVTHRDDEFIIQDDAGYLITGVRS